MGEVREHIFSQRGRSEKALRKKRGGGNTDSPAPPTPHPQSLTPRHDTFHRKRIVVPSSNTQYTSFTTKKASLSIRSSSMFGLTRIFNNKHVWAKVGNESFVVASCPATDEEVVAVQKLYGELDKPEIGAIGSLYQLVKIERKATNICELTIIQKVELDNRAPAPGRESADVHSTFISNRRTNLSMFQVDTELLNAIMFTFGRSHTSVDK